MESFRVPSKKEETSQTYYAVKPNDVIRIIEKKKRYGFNGTGSIVDHNQGLFTRKETVRRLSIPVQEVYQILGDKSDVDVRVFEKKEDAEAYAASLQLHGRTHISSPIKASAPIFKVAVNDAKVLGKLLTEEVTEKHSFSRVLLPKAEQDKNNQKTVISYYVVKKSDLGAFSEPYFHPSLNMAISAPAKKSLLQSLKK